MLKKREEQRRKEEQLEKEKEERLKKEKRKKAVRAAAVCFGIIAVCCGIFSLFKFVILPKTQVSDIKETTAESKNYSYVNSVVETESPPDSEYDSTKDYVPRGTAVITANDSKTYTAIANSLMMYSNRIESGSTSMLLYMGLDNRLDDDSYYGIGDTYSAENMIYFSNMFSVERKSDALCVVDIDNKETDITPPENAELWYPGEENGLEPESILLSDVKSIIFDRENTPDFDVRYACVYTSDETYLSPVAYIWFNINTSSGGIPYMEFSKELTQYADQPVTVQNMEKLIITKNGSSGSMFSAPESIECRAELRSGDDVSFEMNSYFSFWTMGSNGSLKNPGRDKLKEIDFYPE